MIRFATLPCATALLGFGLALAGCNRAAPANEATVMAPTTNYLATIEALPEGQRKGVFLRAIRDSGEDCQGVNTSQETKTGDGKPAWTATCLDGSTYVLVLDDKGMMTVVSSVKARGTGA